MKNRRLNVLFIAIIALAAAPQAMHDAHRLVNAAQERAESEFWSIFLSYTSPEAGEAKTYGSRQLIAERRRQETEEVCPTERTVVRQAEASRNSRPSETRMRTKAETGRAASQEEENTTLSETVEAASDNRNEVATLSTVRPVVFSETEQTALRTVGVHARDAEKSAEAASRGSLASFAPGSQMQLKIKQVEMDRLLRQRTRTIKDRGETSYEIQTPNTVGSM
ncbi:MAG TPA: hypothetical protein VF717_06160 [Pyrinomonadaceae bacterium]|jgi:hypothetical protein